MTAGQEPAGALFVVSTPIGNLGDMTARAQNVLAIADVIACEDTRRTGSLLSALGIAAPKLMRLDAHTEAARAEGLVARAAAGERVALVSDAGTPAVSDPGARLVDAFVDAGVRVVPVPGASAALAALVASGLPTARFSVDGFLPRKGRGRADLLAEIATRRSTTVIYESPNRLGRTLDDLGVVCGHDRIAAVARELTKLHEEIVRGTLRELAERYVDGTKGEVVIVVAPAAPAGEADDPTVIDALRSLADRGETRRSAVGEVSRSLAVAKGRVYDLALTIEWPT